MRLSLGVAALSITGVSLWVNFTVVSVNQLSASYTTGIYTAGVINRLAFSVLLNTEIDVEIATVQPIIYPFHVDYLSDSLLVRWDVYYPPGVYVFILSSVTNWDQRFCMNASGIRFEVTVCDIGLGSLTYVILQEGYLAKKFSGELPVINNYMALRFNYFPSNENMLFVSIPYDTVAGFWTDSQHAVKVGSNNYLHYQCVEQGVVGFSSSSKCRFLLLNPDYACGSGRFMMYNQIGGLPELSCGTCHSSCLTCTYNTIISSISTDYDCTSCPLDQSLVYSDGMIRGRCRCNDGSLPEPGVSCKKCK